MRVGAMPRRPSMRDAQRAFSEYKEFRRMNPMPAPEPTPEPGPSSSSRSRNPNRPFDDGIMAKWCVVTSEMLDHHSLLMKAAFHQAIAAKLDQLEQGRVKLDELD